MLHKGWHRIFIHNLMLPCIDIWTKQEPNVNLFRICLGLGWHEATLENTRLLYGGGIPCDHTREITWPMIEFHLEIVLESNVDTDRVWLDSRKMEDKSLFLFLCKQESKERADYYFIIWNIFWSKEKYSTYGNLYFIIIH